MFHVLIGIDNHNPEGKYEYILGDNLLAHVESQRREYTTTHSDLQVHRVETVHCVIPLLKKLNG